MSEGHVPMASLMVLLTLVLGALTYYVMSPGASVDPLKLFTGPGLSTGLAAPKADTQDAEIEALVSAIADGKGLRGKGGNVIYMKKEAPPEDAPPENTKEAREAAKKELEAKYEKMVLEDLVVERHRKEEEARQHAQETVNALVEEAAQEIKDIHAAEGESGAGKAELVNAGGAARPAVDNGSNEKTKP